MVLPSSPVRNKSWQPPRCQTFPILGGRHARGLQSSVQEAGGHSHKMDLRSPAQALEDSGAVHPETLFNIGKKA